MIVLAAALAGIVLAVLLRVARLTPWPFEIAVVVLGLIGGVLAASTGAGLVLVVCAAALPICALLTLHTIKQTFDAATAARRAARPRRRPGRANTSHEEGEARRAA